MFKASTYFIKGQLPGTTAADIATQYTRAFNIQSSAISQPKTNKLQFSNNTLKFSIDRFSGKLSSFSKGEINIADEGDKFVVYFEAQWTRLFIIAGLIAGAVFVTNLSTDQFTFFPFVFAAVVFILLVVTGYLYTIISFPVYFTSLRNSIEQELRAH